MKKFFSFMVILFMAVMCPSLLSCSDDNNGIIPDKDEDTELVTNIEKNFIGIWRQRWCADDFYSITDIIIKADHTYHYQGIDDTFDGTWKYNIKENKIEFTCFNSDAPDIAYHEYAVVDEDFTSFINYDNNGEDMCGGGKYPFIRLSDELLKYDDKIIGEWEQYCRSGGCFIIFNENHTYSSVIYNERGEEESRMEGVWEYFYNQKLIYTYCTSNPELNNQCENYFELSKNYRHMKYICYSKWDNSWYYDECLFYRINYGWE